jgi:LysM repeat protein
MKTSGRMQRVVVVAVVLALFASLMLGSAAGLAVSQQDVLYNGSFEAGFSYVAGCGMVGNGWGCFTNGGSVAYGFYDDQWAPVRADGAHSQLIEMNTMQPAASEANRYAGIYQTVNLVRGNSYQFKLSGLMREALKDGNKPDPNDDPFRYRVQWGYTPNGSADWTQVTNWVELPWNKIDNRTSPTSLENYATSFVAPSDQVTIFIRLWKKWGTVYREINFNVDAVSLWGPAVAVPYDPGAVIVLPPPGGGQQPPVVVVKPPKHPPVVVQPPVQPPVVVQPIAPPPVVVQPIAPPPPIPVQPIAPVPGACSGPNMVVNGSFEAGFTNGVGNYWTSYTNGGQAGYGFYDEQWPPVIQDGANGQLIEINTKGISIGDPNRVAGIYQVVQGLVPGATYQFSVWGQMREEAAHPGEDPYRYEVQWGFTPSWAGYAPSMITNWTSIPWQPINLRTAPGPMQNYSAQFVAPSNSVVLAIQGLKKWGTPYRELDVNLDAISITCCPTSGGGVVIVPPPPPPPPGGGGVACGTVYIVKRGDSLAVIARRYGVTVSAIVACNGITNPNVIYAGQRLCIPR